MNISQYGNFVQQYWTSGAVQQVGATTDCIATITSLPRTARKLAPEIPFTCHQVMHCWRHGREVRSCCPLKMKGAHVFVRTPSDGWQLGVIHQVSRARDEPRPYNVKFVDMARRCNVSLPSEKYSTDVAGPPSSWCFLVHVRSGSVRRSVS